MKFLLNQLFIALVFCVHAQLYIRVPDIDGYTTLKADLHLHTVFSDGLVWPTFRIEEAIREGIHVIALSEHLEYHPFSNYVLKDNNASYDVAKKLAEKHNVILLRAAEITRSMPPGHSNAVFLADANALKIEDYFDAYQEAVRQGAFIFWNHPCWKVQQPDTVLWWNEHTRLYQAGLLHGIEIVNANDYCPKAHQWCIEKNLAMIGSSDLHYPASYVYSGNQHRPLTLLFVREASADGCREALFARRTLVLHNHTLYGFQEFLEPFVRACINITSVKRERGNQLKIFIQNRSNITFRISFPELSDVEMTLEDNENVIILNAEKRKIENMAELSVMFHNAFPEPEKKLLLKYQLK